MRVSIRVWLAVWAGWTALALFFAVSTALTYRTTGRPANWTITVERSLSEWWLWALLTPLVVWLARRYPLDGRRRWRHALLHAACGLLVALAKSAADRAILALIAGLRIYWLLSSIALQFFVYAMIVVAAHGVEYYRRSREREHLEARLAETRLQLLSLQLQPHFLFNTLNTIAELVYERPEAADRMIAGLSGLLRRALELGGSQEIPLRAELDLLSDYLDIQKTRFGDRLDVRIDISDAAWRASVPVMLLQPIVENAIRHGLGTHAGAGRIEISARQQGGTLLVTVIDDGRGAADYVAGHDGVGLGNTRARLDAIYGGNHHLDLTSLPERGARVDLAIPFRDAV
jgi:LytS/YehU family sensor histidine kinase